MGTEQGAEPRRTLVIAGLPGSMATQVARAVAGRRGDGATFELAPVAFSGVGAARTTWTAGEAGAPPIELLGPPAVASLASLAISDPRPLVVDLTTPMAATANALAYAEAGLSFVMGTTGADVAMIDRAVREAGIAAVVAPNMAAPIVVLTAMLDWAAAQFPGALAGLDLAIAESHQAAKRDVSGTARRLLPPLARLAGLAAHEARITSIRAPDEQRALGIPEEALGAHAWHRYALASDDGTMALAIEHRVLGRGVYVAGTLRAARFLDAMTRADGAFGGRTAPGAGRLFSMLDVLHAGAA